MIVFTSFLFALNNLYLYYTSDVRKNVEMKRPFLEEGEEKRFEVDAEEGFGT